MPFLVNKNPRQNYRNQGKWSFKQSYKLLQEDNNKELEDKFPPYFLYIKILREYTKLILGLILLKRYTFHLPFFLGSIYVAKISSKVKSQFRLNYEAMNAHTKATGEKVKIYHTNEHSDFQIYRFKWRREVTKVANIKFYSFLSSKFNKALLSFCIKELKMDYYE
jgi:hypothetical protein